MGENDRILLPASEEQPYIAELADQSPFVGRAIDDTAGDDDYLCCGCRRALFRQFTPNAQVRALAWRCRCGQVNVFG